MKQKKQEKGFFLLSALGLKNPEFTITKPSYIHKVISVEAKPPRSKRFSDDDIKNLHKNIRAILEERRIKSKEVYDILELKYQLIIGDNGAPMAYNSFKYHYSCVLRDMGLGSGGKAKKIRSMISEGKRKDEILKLLNCNEGYYRSVVYGMQKLRAGDVL